MPFAQEALQRLQILQKVSRSKEGHELFLSCKGEVSEGREAGVGQGSVAFRGRGERRVRSLYSQICFGFLSGVRNHWSCSGQLQNSSGITAEDRVIPGQKEPLRPAGHKSRSELL